MNYLVTGWNKFKFLVAPDELENILQDFHFVRNNSRVPENYIESNQKEYFNKYKTFYEKLTSNYKFTNNILIGLIIGVSNDLSKCTYGEKFMDKLDGKYYRLQDFIEPVVGINVFALTLFLDENKKLFSNYSYLQFPENVFGMEITYPKEIDYYEKGNNEIIKSMVCNEMETYNCVYKIIEQRIKDISKNFTFSIDDKKYRTNIKISKNILDEIKNIYFIKNNNCIIK